MLTTARVFGGLVVTSCVVILLRIQLRTPHKALVLSPVGMEPSREPGVSTKRYSSTLNDSTCQGKEKNQVLAFVKVPKTGSSTLYTIFMRFTLAHRLNVILSKSIMLNLKEERGKSWDIGPDNQSRADVVFNHVTYNEEGFQKYLKPNYKMIFPVREPVSWFKSQVRYTYKKVTTNRTLAERIIMDANKKSDRVSVHLKQLNFLGFNRKNGDSLIEIQEYISYAVPKIDIPVLNDKFDASLVMLKRKFCWNYIDIFYQKSTVTNSSSMKLSEEAVEKLLSAEFNKGDQLLYKAVEKLWLEQPEVKEKDFWDEASYFTSLNKRVAREWCITVTRKRQPYVIHSTQFHGEIRLTLEFCRRLKMNKFSLNSCVKRYAFGKTVSKNTAIPC